MIIVLLLIGIVIALIAIVYQLVYGKDIKNMSGDELLRYIRMYLITLLISIFFTCLGVFL